MNERSGDHAIDVDPGAKSKPVDKTGACHAQRGCPTALSFVVGLSAASMEEGRKEGKEGWKRKEKGC